MKLRASLLCSLFAACVAHTDQESLPSSGEQPVANEVDLRDADPPPPPPPPPREEPATPAIELDCTVDAECDSVGLTLSGPQACCFRCSSSAANVESRDAILAWCESQPAERDCPKKKCAKPRPTTPRCVEGQCQLVPLPQN